MQKTIIIYNEESQAFMVAVSNNPTRRLRELQKCTPYKLTIYKIVEESRKEILDDCAHYRLRGCWIKADPIVKEYISRLTPSYYFPAG